jgi:tripartite-type tricarboxylate transporter receptor subunit TctC
VTSAEPSDLLPDVPTMIAAGVKDYVVNTWMGFAVPAAVPESIASKLNGEINRLGQSPQIREKMLAQGVDMLRPRSPGELQGLIRDDLALWLPIIKASGAIAE